MNVTFLSDMTERDCVKGIDCFIRDREEGHLLPPGTLRYSLFDALYVQLQFSFWMKV